MGNEYSGYERRIETLEDWVRRHEEITAERVERLVTVEQQLIAMQEWRKNLRTLTYWAVAQTIAILGVLATVLATIKK